MPRISNRTFYNPGMNPIKTMPSIRDVMSVRKVEEPADQSAGDTPAHSGTDSASQSVDEASTAPAVREETVPQPADEPSVSSGAGEILATPSSPSAMDATSVYPGKFDDIEYEEPKSDDVDDDDDEDDEEDVVVTPAPVAEEPAEEKAPDFATCWNELFETMFAKNHLIYFSLKDEVPKYENDVIHIEVKNNIQKEQFEMNKRAILEFWRNHYTLNVDDIVITANENKETKKVIINAEDKMRNMIEQNASLPEFLNILGFHLKE